MRRNGGQGCYRANQADQAAWDRAHRPKVCKLVENRAVAQIVADKLQLQWSPEQIAGWLKRSYPDDTSYQVSHETIYRTLFIQARGALKKELLKHLASEAASPQGLPAVKKGLVASAETLEMHRDLRHNFAHWAGRRTKHHDAFVLLTTSSYQAKKKGITALEVGMLGFVVFSIHDIERKIENLISHNEYLALAVNFLGNYARDPASVV